MKKLTIIISVLLMLTLPVAAHFSADDPRLIFTPEERDWLIANPIITVSPDPNYAPVEFYDAGTFQGLSIDYLNWISTTYGIQFQFVYYESWADIMEALKKGEVQLQSGIIKTAERDKYLSFTDPYSDMPSVLMIRKDFKEPLTDETLFNYKVGLINDFAVEEYIRTKYQPENLYELENVKVALESLSTGKVDVLVLDIGQATYYVNKMGLTNLMITNDVQLDFAIQLSFATRKDQLILTGIMDKALKSMPIEVQQSYANKWLGIGEFVAFDSKLLNTILTILSAVILLFLVVFVWLLTLRKKDNQLAKVNAQLEEQISALKEAQHQLVELEKINALSRLAIGLSHEINTPIGNGITIVSFIQNLAQELSQGLKDPQVDLNEIVSQINQSSTIALKSLQKTAKIIQDFHSVANYQLDTSEKEINLSNELEQISIILSGHEAMRSELSLKIEKDIYTLMSYNILLQIISALMENSFLHGYNKQPGIIEIQLYQEENWIVILYRDFGSGISKQELPKVFEPFYSTRRGTDERLGLGLYTVYNIVTHVLEGKIAVTSDSQNGTAFTIKFPQKRQL